MRFVRTMPMLVGLVLLIGGCAGMMREVPRPSAEVTDVSLRSLSVESVILRWTLRVTNPYTVSLPINEVGYRLDAGGRRFLQGTLHPETSVPAGGSTTVPLETEVPFDRLRETLESLKPGSVVPYRASLALQVEAPVLGPIAVESRSDGELPVPAAPGVRLGTVGWEELSMQAARANVELILKNPNAFSLDVRSLSYRLHLGGHPVGDLGLERPLNLEPGGSGRLSLRVSFSPLRFGTELLNVLRSERASYRLEGTLSAGTRFGELTLPVDREGSVDFRSAR